MEERKVSNFNDEFDLRLFIRVAKRNSAWVILFFIISFLIAFLYLRYTHPKYQAKSIIQIQKETNAPKGIFPSDGNRSSNLASKIELLRSPNFLERVFFKLPLDIGYYQIGNVLNYEMYRTSPFEIEYRNPINDLFNVPVYVSFIDEGTVNIKVNINNRENIFKLETSKWFRTPILDSLKINVKNYEKIRDDMKGMKEHQYFFIINKRENLVRMYAANLEVTAENDAAKTIKIIYTERNAAKAADICNNLAEEFKLYDIEKQAESANKTIKFVDEQLKQMYDKLYDSEFELQRFKKENKLDDELPLPDFSSRINDLEKQLNEIELFDATLKTIEEALAENTEIDIYSLASLLTGSNLNNPELRNMLNELRELMRSREELLYSKTQNSAAVAKIDYKIDIQKKLLTETIFTIKRINADKKHEIEERIALYEDNIRSNVLRFDRLELMRLMKMQSISEKYYNRLVDIKSELTIANAGLTSESVVLETSGIPTTPYFPSRRLVALSALAGWILVSIGLIIVRYLLFNEITSMNEITKYLDVPMLGIVPNYKDVIPISQLIVDKKPKSIISESLRSIRSNLEFLSSKEGSKVLAITSTISGEGKTFVALNLAGIIAFSEKKVIILDLDMRKPKIHVGFGVPNDKGMSTILINRNTVEECIFKSSLNNLDFITAGPVPPNPSELIISTRMMQVIDELKERYDMIVIDNPPVGLVTDGIRIFKIADYPIYVFRENFSKRNFVQNVKKIIRDNNIKNLSVILNSVDIKRSGYGYSGVYDYDYGYGYGYGFGYYDEDIRREKFSLKEFFRRLISK